MLETAPGRRRTTLDPLRRRIFAAGALLPALLPMTHGGTQIALAAEAAAAGQPSAPAPAPPGAPGVPSVRLEPAKPGSQIMVGPVRVTLRDGHIADGIGVIREPDRVRLVLDDGTELAFEPSRVASIRMLADIESEPPAPAPAPAPERGAVTGRTRSSAKGKKPAESSSKGRNGPAGTAPASGSAAATTAGWTPAPFLAPSGREGAGLAPVTLEGSGAGAGPSPRTPAAGAGSAAGDATVPAAPPAAATRGGVKASPPAAAAPESSPKKAGTDTEELAAMLQSAISEKEREVDKKIGVGAGTPVGEAGEGDTGGDGDDGGEEGEGSGAEGLEGGVAGGSSPGKPSSPSASKGPTPGAPDATRPSLISGINQTGPGRPYVYPETPPANPDFPKPANPVTSFGNNYWKPTSGFKHPAEWSKPLPPATSFSRSLSGWGAPITSLHASWWAPVPTKWPTALNNDLWRPTDGFARSQEQRQQFIQGGNPPGEPESEAQSPSP